MCHVTFDCICLSWRFMNTSTPLWFLVVDSLSIFCLYKLSPLGRKRIPTSAACRVAPVNHYLLHMLIVIRCCTELAIALFSNLLKSESTWNLILIHLVSTQSKIEGKRKK